MNAEANNTGQEIKRHFYDAKRQQLGKAYTPAARQKRPEYWESAGQLCIDLKADPFTFVKAAFMFNNVPGGPYPNQMGGGAARRWYNEWRRTNANMGVDGTDVADTEIRELIAHALRISMNQLECRPAEYLLSEFHVRAEVIPAFVRVLLFPKNQAILDKWGRRAADELKGNPRVVESLQRIGYKLDVLEQYD